MTRPARALLAALALLAAPAAAIAQSFPITLPAQSVYGRLGTVPGPGQAIPFSTLMQNLFLTTAPARYVFATRSVNFNAANTDTSIAITLPAGVTRYVVTAVRIANASTSLTTATAGVFTQAAGGGVAIVTGSSAITVSSTAANTNNSTQSMTVNNGTTASYNVATLFFRIATAEGVAATGDVIIEIGIL